MPFPWLAGEDLTAADLNAAVGVTKYKTADESLISSTTFQDDDQLTGWVVVANGVYSVELVGQLQASVAGSFKQRFVLPSGTLESITFAWDPGTADIQSVGAGDGQVTGVTGTAANEPWLFWATLFVGATGGTFKWQWAQNASDATATIVRKGTRCTVTRIA